MAEEDKYEDGIPKLDLSNTNLKMENISKLSYGAYSLNESEEPDDYLEYLKYI